MKRERLTLEQAKARAELSMIDAGIDIAHLDWQDPAMAAMLVYGHGGTADAKTGAAAMRIVFALIAYDRQLAYDEGYAAKGESVAEELEGAAQAANDALDSGSTKWFAPDMTAGQVRLYVGIVTKLAAEERAGEILRGVP